MFNATTKGKQMKRVELRWVSEGKAVSGRWCGNERRFKTREAAIKSQPSYAAKYPSDYRARPILVW
jgi:hypothetical protein